MSDHTQTEEEFKENTRKRQWMQSFKKRNVAKFYKNKWECENGGVLSKPQQDWINNQSGYSECQRKYHYKRQYGVLIDDVVLMLKNQNNLCACCSCVLDDIGTTKQNGRKNIPHVDHNHSTGKVRAILCRNCNLTIGHAMESIELLEKAIVYLRKHQQEPALQPPGSTITTLG